jgi:hypothetical protein
MDKKTINLAPYLSLAKNYTNKRIFGVFLFGS